MSEVIILLILAVVIGVILYKDVRDRERSDRIMQVFDNTLNNIITTTAQTNNKFYEMVSKIETAHFNNLEKHSEKQLDFMKDQMELLKDLKTPPPPVIEKIGSIDATQNLANSIEEEQTEEFPLEDIPRIPMVEGINVQLEGEEEIYPINIEK